LEILGISADFEESEIFSGIGCLAREAASAAVISRRRIMADGGIFVGISRKISHGVSPPLLKKKIGFHNKNTMKRGRL